MQDDVESILTKCKGGVWQWWGPEGGVGTERSDRAAARGPPPLPHATLAFLRIPKSRQ